MIIYKDVINGAELFTDASKFIKKDGIIEIETKKVSESTDVDDSLIGGNASAEEAAEGTDSSAVTGYDIVIQNRLQSMPTYDKKSFLAYLKDYSKKIKAHMQKEGKSDEEVKQFEGHMNGYAKRILKNIKELEVFVGESDEEPGMAVFIDYREDGTTAYAMFVEQGVVEEKV